MKRRLWFAAALALACGCAPQGSGPIKDEQPPPAADVYLPPRHYVCCRASGPITVDGRIDEAAWNAVPWTEDFVDIEGDRKPAPRFRTRAKMLWDDQYFYIAAELKSRMSGPRSRNMIRSSSTTTISSCSSTPTAIT